ncbi:phospholipid scramblase 1 [Saitozyma podzolica]|uniref:Phospholipid scramblase 1 n=1 Tax=Saitozyma podzolica TaxID=1890683 RepID=A0A427YMS8_9TREE|nr:phospholipid scramblase 1 [Saitozyma podzolica]
MSMRNLLAVWGFLDVCLLAAGVISIVFGIKFHMPGQLVLNLTFSDKDCLFGIILGATYLSACLFSIPAILSPRGRPFLLKALNGWLIVISAFTLAIGTYIWFFSLRQLNEFAAIWAKQSPAVQQAIQDNFSCCGYWNSTAAGEFTTHLGFCADVTPATNITGCESFITSADSGSSFDLENVFSSIYGFELIIGCFFLATVCVINERAIEVRFERIDEKRGGGGFV